MPLAPTIAPFMPGVAMLRVISVAHVRADSGETEPTALVRFKALLYLSAHMSSKFLFFLLIRYFMQ